MLLFLQFDQLGNGNPFPPLRRMAPRPDDVFGGPSRGGVAGPNDVFGGPSSDGNAKHDFHRCRRRRRRRNSSRSVSTAYSNEGSAGASAYFQRVGTVENTTNTSTIGNAKLSNRQTESSTTLGNASIAVLLEELARRKAAGEIDKNMSAPLTQFVLSRSRCASGHDAKVQPT